MIQQTLASDATQQPGEPPLMLRVSVHLCDVEHCETGAYGDGINVAARLLPYSPEGGLCLSAGIRALVRQRLNLPLRPIGTPALKNIEEPVEAFVLHADELLAVQLAGELPTPRRRLSGLRLGAIAAGLGVVVLLWALGLIETPSAQAPGVEPMPSLAVLPFDNRSPDPADAFFAEGVQDEILTRLARVGSIKVVSRSSTRGYGAQPSDLRRVGRELGVNHLLLGSVQRAGDRVRINVHLVDAQSRATRWAELYDRSLADVLSVQTEVASAVVTALDTRLARADQVALARVPTTDSGAYDAYLRGRYYQNRAETTPANFNGAAQHFEDAVRLDPSFALAWAQLSYMHSQIHWFGFDATPARLAQAENAAATAARLQPELGEAFLARGYVRYWGYQDYDGALALFAEAERRLPNDAEVPMAQSYVYQIGRAHV
jgi:TolB-like protein